MAPRQNTVKLRFNSAGRLTSWADRNGNTIEWGYNGSGQLVSITDANNLATSFDYTGGLEEAALAGEACGARRVRQSVMGSLSSRADNAQKQGQEATFGARDRAARPDAFAVPDGSAGYVKLVDFFARVRMDDPDQPFPRERKGLLRVAL